MVRRRHVFFIYGYNPLDAHFFYRMCRLGLFRFSKLWPIKISVGDLQVGDDGVSARWQIKARAPNWRVETTLEILRWDDIIVRDMRRPTVVLFARVLYFFIENLLNGTTFRVFRAGWRFGLFYLFTIVMLFLRLAIAVVVGWLAYLLAHEMIGAGSFISAGAGIVAFAGFWALSRSLYDKGYVTHMCHAWVWSDDWIRGRSHDFMARSDEFARRIVAKARAGDVDEVLVFGHSAGGALAIPVIARALELDPDFSRAGTPVTFAALGSQLPFGMLQPLAHDLRKAVRRLAIEPSVTWIECRARKDIVNFQDCDVIETLGIDVGPQQCNPLYWNVRFRDVLSPKTYGLLRWNFFRIHQQFVMPNDRRAPYDYYMFLCGPIRLLDWAKGTWDTFAHLADDASYKLATSDSTDAKQAIGADS